MFPKTSNILVVDDMKTVRKLVTMALKEAGFQNVVEATNGSEAWTLIGQKTKFDLIISDWNMPEMTGLDLLKKVRSTPECSDVPFIMLTAESESQQVLAAVQAKVNNYIVKPFTPTQILEKMSATYAKVKAAA
jgi:two-component system chemotaxis response regulator CheY